MTHDEKGERDQFFDRYRKHTGSVVVIDSAGRMTVREAVERGHLQRITEGIYRPNKGKQ